MKKKLFLTIVLICLALTSVFANDFYLGVRVPAGRDYLTEAGSAKLQGLEVEAYKNASFVYGIGPGLQLRYYPFEKFQLGFHSSVDLLFITSIGTNGYRSYKGDGSLDLAAGLSYMQYFTPTLGMFIDADFNYLWYRFAKNNEPNHKEAVDYIRFTEYGVKGTLGFITRNDNKYFSFGFSYDYHLSSKPKGMVPICIFVGGGFIF